MEQEISVGFPGGKVVQGEIAGFKVTTDQSVEQGGTGTAPNPLQYFLLSMATCMGYFAAEFCRKRGISTESMSLRVKAARAEGSKIFNQFDVLLKVSPDFPEKFIGAVARSMEQCAVKQHLRDDIAVSTRVEVN